MSISKFAYYFQRQIDNLFVLFWSWMKFERTFNFTPDRLLVRKQCTRIVKVVGVDDSSNPIGLDFEKVDNPPVKLNLSWFLMASWPPH